MHDPMGVVTLAVRGAPTACFRAQPLDRSATGIYKMDTPGRLLPQRTDLAYALDPPEIAEKLLVLRVHLAVLERHDIVVVGLLEIDRIQGAARGPQNLLDGAPCLPLLT